MYTHGWNALGLDIRGATLIYHDPIQFDTLEWHNHMSVLFGRTWMMILYPVLGDVSTIVNENKSTYFPEILHL